MTRFILSLALLIGTFTYAGNPNRELARRSLISTEMVIEGKQALKIRFDNPLAKDLKVEVRSESGILILRNNLDDMTNYAGRYEFANMTEGSYTFSILLDGVLIDEKTVEVE